MPFGDEMTDREIAREAHDLARSALARNDKLTSIADKALAMTVEHREREMVMTGAATLANDKLKGIHAEYQALIKSLGGLHARLVEAGEDEIADDLRNIWLASLDRLNSNVLQSPAKMH